MIVKDGVSYFEFFDGMPYGITTDSFDNFKKLVEINVIDKNKVVKYIESLSFAATSAPASDMFSGERLQAGIYEDEKFRFPVDFLHYYKKYDIGIPAEYEEYLIDKVDFA